MDFFTMLSTPLCLLLFFLCLKTVFSSSLHASSLSTTQLCSREEALALLQFKNSFSINSNASDPFYCTQPYSKTESWKEGVDCCSWDGVSCDNVTGHVTALDLSCSRLFGSFPSNSTIFLLKNLQSLNLTTNDFRFSKIPPEISQFTGLKHLDISRSRFSGRVPREIAHLHKLVSLNLSIDFFSDSLNELILETTTFRNLVHNLSEVRELVLEGVNMASVNPRFFMNLSSSLTILDLYGNELRGNFPNSILRFPNLKEFFLYGQRTHIYGKENLTIDLQRSNWSSPLQYLWLGATNCGRGLPEFIGDLKSLQVLFLSCNLEGSIPSSLANLTQLESLDLSGNQFLGSIPAFIENLSQLTYLRLSSNNLSRQIPSSLANLTQLRSLGLSSNKISGQIPSSLANLTQLRSLDLSYNKISGQIPSSLANLTQLEFLDLSGNQFLGSIPAFIGNLSQLTYLWLSSNNLSGQIPSSLANLTQLVYLDLSFNKISGQIPSSLANLTQLWSLDLSVNQFLGSIPAFIGNLSQLTNLWLSSNNLSGQIPSSLANLTQLEFLDLSGNQFLGSIPAFIGNLSQLTYLWLSSNNLSGQIPSSLANLTQLESLGLSDNKISGPLPFHAIGFSKLCQLDLSYNLLNGTMPPWIFTLPLLEFLQLNHNQLQGPIPSSIAALVNLSYLDLSSNHFSDLVVLEMFSGLQNLEYIILSYNNLSLGNNVHANFTLPKLIYLELSSCNLSQFPNFLKHSNGLRSLVLSKNSIHGKIPGWICEQDGLEILDLSHNNLIGKIPNCLPKSLSVLNLQANNFNGNIPFRFPEGCRLQNLNLHGNQMGWLLPRSLVNCNKLEVLDVGNNNIEDTFPHWLGSLPELQVLVLRFNEFHGSVQSIKEVPSFLKLRVLDLSSNYFVGALPVCYIENFNGMMNPQRDDHSPTYMMATTSSYQYSLVVTMKGFYYELERILTTFTSIDLSNNKFEGEIPDVIGKLSYLKGLNLSHNNLSGPISPSLGNLTNLEWLDLSSNQLKGEIPDELVSLTQLEVLNLSNNHLIGRIPQGKQFDTFGNDSYGGNLGLCGFPLSKSCDVIGTQDQPPSSFQEKDELWRFGWRVVALGYGCGVVFGLLMGYHVFRTGKPKWFVSLFSSRPSSKKKSVAELML